MAITYNVQPASIYGPEIIWYEQDGYTVSFMKDEANPDYQAYLAWLENPEAEQSTPNLTL
jgi:hypothetical protein